MEKLQKKLKKQGGFTLVEMLIVVAIIAILIAVSIPMVGGALDKARQATDAANVRAAKAEAAVQYLAGDAGDIQWKTDTGFVVNCYDADKGQIVKTDNKPNAGYGKYQENKGDIIYVAIQDSIVYYQWADRGIDVKYSEDDGPDGEQGWLLANQTIADID